MSFAYLSAPVRRLRSCESKRHDASVGILRVKRDVEAELPAHAEHDGILAQHLALDGLEAFGTAIFDHHLHEQVAEPTPLEIGADENSVFTALVVGIGVQANHAEHPARAFLDRDEGHGARIVDLREARDEAVAELLY